MIVKPTNFTPPSIRHDNYDRIKLAVAMVCRELGLKANLSLSTMWMICCEDSDKESFVQLVNEELKEL